MNSQHYPNNQNLDVLNTNMAALLAHNPQLSSAASFSQTSLKEMLNVLLEQSKNEEEKRRKTIETPEMKVVYLS